MVDGIITLLAIRKQRQYSLGYLLMLAKVQLPRNFGDNDLYFSPDHHSHVSSSVNSIRVVSVLKDVLMSLILQFRISQQAPYISEEGTMGSLLLSGEKIAEGKLSCVTS